MPIYDIDLDDGRTVTVESDSEPNEQQIFQALSGYEGPPRQNPEAVDLLGEESRRIPGIQATTQGAPQRRQTGPGAFGGIAAQIQQEPLPSFSESLRPILPSHIGPEESLLAISPAGVATGAEITEATGIPKAVTIPVSGAGKAVAGLGQLLTSPAGIAQSAIAMIPGVGILQRAKWIYDIARGTGETAGSLYDRIAKIATSPDKTTTEEWQGLAEDAANTALMLYGAGKLTSHEVSSLTGIRAPLGRAFEPEKTRLSKDLAREIEQAPVAAETIPTTQPIAIPDPRGEPIPGIAENASLMDAALREAQQRIVQPGQVPAIDLLRRQREDQIVPAGTAEPLAFEGGGEAPFGQVSYMRKAEAPLPEKTQQALEREKQNASEITKATGVPELEVRTQLGEEAPLRQSGETAIGTGRSAEGEGLPQQQPQAEVVPTASKYTHESGWTAIVSKDPAAGQPGDFGTTKKPWRVSYFDSSGEARGHRGFETAAGAEAGVGAIEGVEGSKIPREGWEKPKTTTETENAPVVFDSMFGPMPMFRATSEFKMPGLEGPPQKVGSKVTLAALQKSGLKVPESELAKSKLPSDPSAQVENSAKVKAEPPPKDTAPVVNVPEYNGGTIRVTHGGTGKMEGTRPVFFSKEPEGAMWYSGDRGGESPQLVEADVTITKPARISDIESAVAAVGATAKDVKTHSGYEGESPIDFVYVPKVVAELKRRGFDGVIDFDQLSNGDILAAIPFDKTQIKEISRKTGKRNPETGMFEYSPIEEKQLTESQFDRQYAQHIDLRARGGDATSQREKILREGFKKGANVNALPPTKGTAPNNVIERNFQPKSGDLVLLAPKEAWEIGPNGMEIKDGWKPKPHEAIIIKSDNPNMYQEYIRAKSESAPKETAPVQKQTAASAKEPWEMTRDEYTNQQGGKPPPAETQALDAISNKNSRKPYNPELITPQSVEFLKKAGLIKGNKNITLTSAGIDAIYTQRRFNKDADLKRGDAWDNHPDIVEKAIREGKPVPPEVLAEYPELKAAAKATPPQPGIISGTVVESWATDKIVESKKRISSGIDPELMAAYAIKGAAYLERGIRDFAKWSAEMVKEYGEAIKPYLRSIYRQANNVFLTPGRYAVEGGKLKIVSEQEARRMERAVKLNRDVSKVKEQLDLFDKEIGDALTSGGKFLPKDMRPDVAKGAPAETGTVTSKSINQYFVNQLVTVRKAMQKIRNELAATADTASIQYFDVLQKRFELSFRKVQELRRASHESLYFWNQIRAEYQDIARMAGETPNIKTRKPIIDQLVKDLRDKEFARAGKDFVDYLRVNLFTPFSFTLDFTTNLMAVAAHTPAWLGMDLAHLVTGKPITRTQTALRALKLAGQNAIPFREKFRLPEEIEVGLGTAAGGEFQGLPKEVMIDFSEILRGNPKLASKLKNLDYVLGGPVRMKRAVDNFFGRFGATAELYNAAYQAGKAKKLKGDPLKEFVEQFVLNPPEGAIADAIRVGGEFKFNRELPEWAERFASNTITKLAVEAYPRWTLQFSKWASEMVGVDPGFFRQVKQGSVSAERLASYLAKAATGWGALYAFNQLFYNQVDPNTMEYVNEKGERTRLSGRQPFPELYTLTALFRGDIKNAKAAFPYTSIPFAGMTGGQGGLLSPIIQTMIESWKGTYTAEQTARELTKMLNNAIPGKSVLGLIRALYDPTVREGVGAPIPGIAQALPTKVNITTGEPAAPKQRIPGTGIMLPTVGGTPFPGAVRMLNPVEKTLMNHGISNIRPKRTSLIEMPATEVPKELRREYEQRTGQNVKAIIGEAIQSKEWKELDGKENFDIRRELLMNWMTLARSMARAELAEKYNKGMGAEKPVPLNVQRLPEFVKQLPAGQ